MLSCVCRRTKWSSLILRGVRVAERAGDQSDVRVDPANDLQAMDRAFRIGQKRTVWVEHSPLILADALSSDVYRLIGQGTLEELMYERQGQLLRSSGNASSQLL